MSYRDALPAWLRNAYTESNIISVLRTLSERESRREYVRLLSRSRAEVLSGFSSGLEASHFPVVIPDSYLEYYSVTTANQMQNIPHNRYPNVVPYDRTRVVVGSDSATGRYLNANWVLERCGHKWWIATQAPLPMTIHTFLCLIMQPISVPRVPLTTSNMGLEDDAATHRTSRIRTVVQLTKNVEGSRTKAHPYFPTEVGKSVIVPPDPELSAQALKVTLMHAQNHEDAHCLQSIVAISPVSSTSTIQSTRLKSMDESEDSYGLEEDDNSKIIFQHLMYTAWPDHGVPEDRKSLLAFVELVDQLNKDPNLDPSSSITRTHVLQYDDPDPPILVGCSAGIGRTGSFIALSSLLRHSGFLPPAATPTPASVIPSSPLGMLPEGLTGDLVLQEIDFLREQRPRMVERPEQTLLIYQILVSAYLAA